MLTWVTKARQRPMEAACSKSPQVVSTFMLKSQMQPDGKLHL